MTAARTVRCSYRQREVEASWGSDEILGVCYAGTLSPKGVIAAVQAMPILIMRPIGVGWCWMIRRPI
jgi:hypothetical protein